MAKKLTSISEKEALPFFLERLSLETGNVFGNIAFKITELKQKLSDAGLVIDTTDELVALFEEMVQKLNKKNPNFMVSVVLPPGITEIALFVRLVNLSLL